MEIICPKCGAINKEEEEKEKVKCPHCEKSFSPQGIQGHIRFVHKKELNGEPYVPTKYSGNNNEVLGISKQIREINIEIHEVENYYSQSLLNKVFNGDNPEKEVLLISLGEKKKELLIELQKFIPSSIEVPGEKDTEDPDDKHWI
ncbi:hypothetical protein ES705_37085 [subsurface metagenome]